MDGGSFAICYHAWWQPTLLFLFEEGIHVWNNNTPSRNTIVIFYSSVWEDETEKKKKENTLKNEHSVLIFILPPFVF